MPIETRPRNPVPKGPRPGSRLAHTVGKDETFETMARLYGVTVHQLLMHNFGTTTPAEINWYLRENVGCRLKTHDGKNWRFSEGLNPGKIYIPQIVTQLLTITHSVATISWIDKRLYDPKDLPEVDDYTDPGQEKERSAFLARSGYRFANFLEAYVQVDGRGQIVNQGFTSGSDLYFAPSFRGIMPKTYPILREAAKAADGKSARFVQTVGCKTVSPETIGAREGVKAVDAILGITPNWGGPLGIQAQNLGAKMGAMAAENFRVFPPIWTELELIISVDGTFQGKLVRYSAFPSLTYYEQYYTVDLLTLNSTKYRQRLTYDARSAIDEWRSKGWGPATGTVGISGGSPWSVDDPRIFGRDLPFAPDIPNE